MSIVIDREDRFLGIPLLTVRNVLRAWRYGGSDTANDIAFRKDVKLDPRTVMVLLEELRDRGLIGPEGQDYGGPIDGLTETGKALASASGQKRISKLRAWSILRKFLDACAAVNARNDLPFDVRKVWIFGSLLDDAKTDVGDVDVVLVMGRPERFAKSAIERFVELAKSLGRENILNSSGAFRRLRAGRFVVNHFLHRGRRHPLLSFREMDELKELACPCRLVFDASKGGLVDEPVLPRHPGSPGRSDEIGDRGRMPDFFAARGPLRPIAAELANPRGFERGIAATGPWPPDDMRYRIVENRTRMHLVGGGAKLPSRVRSNVVTRRLDVSGCDGRHKVGLLVNGWTCRELSRHWETIEYPALGVLLAREIIEQDDVVKYQVKIADEAHRERYMNDAHLTAAYWWLTVLVSADVERIMRRDLEVGTKRAVCIAVEYLVDTPVAKVLAQELAAHAPQTIEATRANIYGDSAQAGKRADYINAGSNGQASTATHRRRKRKA